MKLSELKLILDELNIPVAYHHFIDRTSTPYLVYYVQNSDNFSADDIIYQENITVNLELYTLNKDINLEKSLKELLNEAELPYEHIGETYVESEKVYQTMYEVTLYDYKD